MGAFLAILTLLIPMWLIFVLPQQRRIRAHHALIATLEPGDEVMTTSGLFGTIVGLDDDVVTLEVAEQVEVRFSRGAIHSRTSPGLHDDPIDLAGELGGDHGDDEFDSAFGANSGAGDDDDDFDTD